jgi:hypothetical protein
MNARTVTLAALLAASLPAAADVAGETTGYTSPNGLAERCVRIAPLPGAHYSKHDRKDEADFCELDLHRLALCPKLWSTSPGTIVYDLGQDVPAADIAAWEAQHCSQGHHAKDAAKHKPALFKISVNERDTSATYAPSSWIYYHLSRFLHAGVHVPVSVYRSMDAAVHHERVVERGLQLTGGKRSLRMLNAGWRFLDKAETGQASGAAAAAALTDGGRQVFGVLIDNDGDRYGPEFNGTRESGWGSGQNMDFQQTAPFLALRDPAPVTEAARNAIHEARKNPRMAKALSADIAIEQVVFWMQDVLEITLLDYVLGQQDRIGNIDYLWRWYWIEDGKLESKKAHGRDMPEELAAFKPLRLRQSAINDNDAGVRRGYADFAERTHMLEELRHYSPRLYRRLGLLAADLGAKGEIYQWMTGSAGLSQAEADTIASRAVEAFTLLRSDCESGALKLDLEPAQLLLAPGLAETKAASCAIEAP